MREKRYKVNKVASNLVRSSNPKTRSLYQIFNDEYFLDPRCHISQLREALSFAKSLRREAERRWAPPDESKNVPEKGASEPTVTVHCDLGP